MLQPTESPWAWMRRVPVSTASGSLTTNSLPWPTPSLRTSTVPPCISVSGLTSVSPMPSPVKDRSRDVSTRVTMTWRFRTGAGAVFLALSAETVGHHIGPVDCDDGSCLAPQRWLGPPQIHIPHTPGVHDAVQYEPMPIIVSGQVNAAALRNPSCLTGGFTFRFLHILSDFPQRLSHGRHPRIFFFP